jgi:hypothetical protein
VGDKEEHTSSHRVALDSHSQLLSLDRQRQYRKNSWGRNVINKLEGKTGREDQRS